ncbi:DinB family protein [Ekhidna sp.]|uniref:DinB family protein n=1 Tax=Ekhidna sp. TaxID=2608089 RepID=UPI003297F551
MKKLTTTTICIVFMLTCMGQETISKIKRQKALNHLKQTQSDLQVLIKDLSDEQLEYKMDESSWSVAECLEHIAISEKNLIDMIKMSLNEDSDPSKRSEVAMSDDQILSLITSRDQKVKTRKEFEPTDSFGGYNNTWKTFQERRKANIKFLKTTQADLRNHYMQFPFGLIDTYQGVLFMSGHTKRHTDQIKEIIASNNFPQ